MVRISRSTSCPRVCSFPTRFASTRVTATVPRRSDFAPGLFDFDERYFDDVPDTAPGAGFSGLRLRHPAERADRMDEVLVVQGASYFRAIGQAMVYGLSARAVALGTGGPLPEEFPRFTHLRLHPATQGVVRIEAVIDSPSLAGHLDMTLRPGRDTVTELAVTLLPRREIADIGVAPLTSMYLKGPLRASVSDDFRPRVHDSDVLLIENGAGERLWRPISNPARLETSAFLDDGSGQLRPVPDEHATSRISRIRRPGTMTGPRPSCAPPEIGGVVRLCWSRSRRAMSSWTTSSPSGGPKRRLPGERASLRLFDQLDADEPGTGARRAVVQSRSGREHDRPGTRRYVIDVTGAPDGLMPEISGPAGVEVDGISVFPLPQRQATRLTFLIEPGDSDVADLRVVFATVTKPGAPQVWLHRWTRARDGGV
jgi:glucans biosynthesis protein